MELSRQGDRFGHCIAAELQGTRYDLLRSCEGNEVEEWPASPPLQQLSQEEHAAGPVALLVGMAGHSHWSLSLEAKEDGCLVFDVACRVGKEGSVLGSQYEVLRPFSESNHWQIGASVVELDAVAAYSRIESALQRVAVRPNDAFGEVPHTFRWQYVVRLRGG